LLVVLLALSMLIISTFRMIGADGGISSFTHQQTSVSKQDLHEIKFTGEEPPSFLAAS
jgi:hypothetical protein